jgi:hypothetical protein
MADRPPTGRTVSVHCGQCRGSSRRGRCPPVDRCQPAHQIVAGWGNSVRRLGDAVNGVHPMAHRPATAAPRSRRTALKLNTRGPADGVDDDQERGRGPCSCSNSTAPMPPSHRPPLRGKQPGSTSGQEAYRVHRPSAVEALDRHTDLPRTVHLILIGFGVSRWIRSPPGTPWPSSGSRCCCSQVSTTSGCRVQRRRECRSSSVPCWRCSLALGFAWGSTMPRGLRGHRRRLSAHRVEQQCRGHRCPVGADRGGHGGCSCAGLGGQSGAEGG